MRDHRIPRELESLLAEFKPCFGSRTFENFVSLFIGWILSGGSRTLSRVVSASGALCGRHFSVFYRFFSRASWETESISRVLISIIVARLDGDVEASVDDTLCRRGGPHFFGAAMHHDGASSSNSGGSGASAAFAFGHNWVVVAIRVPLPWGKNKAVALPVLFRLYRGKSRCPEVEYKKRTELAREMIGALRSMVPSEKRVLLTGDSAYACCTLIRALPAGVDFTGPIHNKAALYQAAPMYSGVGRPRRFGARELSPEERFGRSGGRWKTHVVKIYGRDVTLKIKVAVTRWRKVTDTRPVKLVLTRDPSGKFQDRAYFTTDLAATPEQVLARFAARWLIEVCFRDAKQLFGLGDAQNGWGKGKQSKTRVRKKAGPQPRGTKGQRAVERTAPFAWTVYTIVVLWYIRLDRAQRDVTLAKANAPWHRSKVNPSVLDMLVALRSELLARRLSPHPGDWRGLRKTLRAIPRSLLAA